MKPERLPYGRWTTLRFLDQYGAKYWGFHDGTPAIFDRMMRVRWPDGAVTTERLEKLRRFDVPLLDMGSPQQRNVSSTIEVIVVKINGADAEVMLDAVELAPV